MPRSARWEGRERRATRQARHRAAFHAVRARDAQTPAQRLKATGDRLLSAVKHSKRSRQEAPQVTREVVTLAREAAEAAQLAGAAAQLHEHKLAHADLGTALMCLHAALTRHPQDTERDRLMEHYTADLAREAARIEGRR